MRIFLCLLAALSLSACANMQTFDKTMRAFEGHPVNDMAIVLGPHSGQYQRGATTTYVWQDTYRESIFGPRVSSGGGFQIGSASGPDAFMWTGIQFDSCVIRAATQDGIVQKVTMEGNPGGCETVYGQKTHPLGKSAY